METSWICVFSLWWGFEKWALYFSSSLGNPRAGNPRVIQWESVRTHLFSICFGGRLWHYCRSIWGHDLSDIPALVLAYLHINKIRFISCACLYCLLLVADSLSSFCCKFCGLICANCLNFWSISKLEFQENPKLFHLGHYILSSWLSCLSQELSILSSYHI